ncbi:hypothetical protein RB653_001960 [Dictyostelium firmibasis]|uniref:Fe2OG dioxygenase domain-containing protein n=1 Tax=Dictyostelium firmibasis TaxID=79012 RepID=A0AAN7U715_9MYCE
MQESFNKGKQFEFYCKISLVCKSWNLFILPKLQLDDFIFKGDDYIYSYLKVRDKINSLFNSNVETGYKIEENKEINSLYSLLDVPSLITGTYKIPKETIRFNEKNPKKSDINPKSAFTPVYFNNIDSDNENDSKKKEIIINNKLIYDFKIYIDKKECGTIFKPDLKLIQSLSKPSSFGNGDKTVYDETIRKGYHIEGNRVSVPFFQGKAERNNDYGSMFQFDFSHPLVENQFFYKKLNYDLELYKIHIYNEGGHFKPHIDTMHSKNHIGTYIIPLGVDTYEGGEFIISENDKFDETTIEYKIETIDNFEQDTIDFKWIAFYNDCIHKVNPVTKGVRIVLQFNILFNNFQRNENESLITYKRMNQFFEYRNEPTEYDDQDKFLTFNYQNKYESDKDTHVKANKKHLQKLISIFQDTINDRSVNCGLFLSHLYKSNVNENHLKGLDLLIWNEFKDYFGSKRVQVCTFLINSRGSSQLIIKKVSNKSMNQPDKSRSTEEKTHTVMFCGSKYGNLRSILSRPSEFTGNDSYQEEDIGVFSAIIISKP